VAVALFVAAQALHAAAFAAVARHTHTPPAAGHEGWYLLILFPAFLVLGAAIGRMPRAAYLALALTGLVADLVLELLRLPSCYAGGSPLDLLRAGPFRPFEILSAVSLADVRGRWLALVATVWAAALVAGTASKSSSRFRREEIRAGRS
jgi:hypothetical protein